MTYVGQRNLVNNSFPCIHPAAVENFALEVDTMFLVS
jgi:hypothetical protein